jgi:hypothetical protein
LQTRWPGELLCAKCMALIEDRTVAEQAIGQNEICSSCQAVINHLLEAEIERRVHRVMKERGIPPEALQIGTKH